MAECWKINNIEVEIKTDFTDLTKNKFKVNKTSAVSNIKPTTLNQTKETYNTVMRYNANYAEL